MIKIEVRYFATFRKNDIKKEILDFEDCILVNDVLKKVEINEEEVAILLVNGIKSYGYTTLKNGDILSLFPPIGGG